MEIQNRQVPGATGTHRRVVENAMRDQREKRRAPRATVTCNGVTTELVGVERPDGGYTFGEPASMPARTVGVVANQAPPRWEVRG